MAPTRIPADDPLVQRALEALAYELRRHHAPTAEHSNRLAALARRLADHMGLDPLDATEVELVAVLHDVGKLAVPASILDHVGPLDDFQRHKLRRHTIEGEEILIRTAGLEDLAAAVRATHEWWNGDGYPDGLEADQIPFAARIVGVADAFDAMVSDRAYRPAFTVREACRRIDADAARQFDPIVAAALLELVAMRELP